MLRLNMVRKQKVSEAPNLAFTLIHRPSELNQALAGRCFHTAFWPCSHSWQNIHLCRRTPSLPWTLDNLCLTQERTPSYQCQMEVTSHPFHHLVQRSHWAKIEKGTLLSMCKILEAEALHSSKLAVYQCNPNISESSWKFLATPSLHTTVSSNDHHSQSGFSKWCCHCSSEGILVTFSL